MKRQSMRGRLLASTMICGVMALGVTSAAMAADADQGQEVVVTGSRIPQPNLTSVSPLAVVSDVELKAQGTVNVETLLNNMPQVFADFGASVSNGSTGTASVNLRDLGAQRTLVLVDGTRLMPGDPGFPVADLNTIPAALVERVDILTGGASATYGADAVAGVVNFIMKHDFEGVKLDAQYGAYQADNNNGAAHSLLAASGQPIPSSTINGGSWDLAAIIGASSPDHKGNVTAYATYTNLQPVNEGTRDYAACSISATTSFSTFPAGNNYNIHKCQGSSNSAFGRFTPDSGANAGQHFANDPAGGTNFVPYSSSTMAYNYAPFNFFQRSDDRYTGGYFAHYDIDKHFHVYSNFMFSDDHTTAQIAPSALFRGHTYNINCNNPYLTYNAAGTGSGNALCSVDGPTAGAVGFTPPTNTVGFDIGYRFAGFNRQDDLRHTSYRVNLGTKGELVDGWDYETYIQYGTAILSEQYLNDLSASKIQDALLAGGTLPNPTCNSGNAGCIPLNIFSQGGITPAMFNSVQGQGFKEGSTTEQIANFSVTGDLGHYGLKSPWAKDGVGVALGTEYRRETLTEQFSSEFTSGDLTGQGGTAAPAGGTLEVREVYGEFRAPLAQDQEFAKLLQLTGGYRYSQYSGQVGNTDTYKLGLEWAPVDDIRFRAGYNRAVRAPGISDLNGAQTTGLFGGNDPCVGGVDQPTHPTLYAACLLTGLSPAQLVVGSLSNPQGCPAAQCTALFGGNLALKPEKADTYTYGFVFTPTFFHGFSLSLDYFDIKVNNIIGEAGGGPTVAMSQCASGIASYCSLFHRGATGNIFGDGFITATASNNGYLHTTGLDLEGNYRFKFSDMGMGDWGGISINLVGTYTDKLISQPEPGSGTYDCAGLFGSTCGTPVPKWRHKLRVTWNTPWPLSISGQWRYIGSVKYDGNSTNPLLANHPYNLTDTADAKVPSFSYFDLSATWKVNDKMTVRGGVNNVFSKDPPIFDSNIFPVSAPPFGNGNTFPQVYDSLGRYMFIGLTANF